MRVSGIGQVQILNLALFFGEKVELSKQFVGRACALLLFIGSNFGCAHKNVFYEEAGSWDPVGFSEEKFAEGIFDVRFLAQTKPRDAGELLLVRRCAELTLREGFDWFYFYTKNHRTFVKTHVEFPEYYGRIFMKKGAAEADGYDARNILAEPLPTDVIVD